MLAIFLLGFFIDFVEISYIVLPILVPIALNLGINPLYFAIIIAMNLQTSFLTRYLVLVFFISKALRHKALKQLIFIGVLYLL